MPYVHGDCVELDGSREPWEYEIAVAPKVQNHGPDRDADHCQNTPGQRERVTPAPDPGSAPAPAPAASPTVEEVIAEIDAAVAQEETPATPAQDGAATDVETREKQKALLNPPTPEQTELCRVLLTEPDPLPPLLTMGGEVVLTAGVVGAVIAAGGTGKSMLLAQLAYALAEGGSLGPLRAARPFKTLYVAAEDPASEAMRRFWQIGKQAAGGGEPCFPPGLHVLSTVGTGGPLLQYDEKRNQIETLNAKRLRFTIETHQGLEVLILDPKSRLFGLDENKNEDNTAFIALLESVCQEYSITTLFTHHVNKAGAGTLEASAARGGSALVDGCRWVAAMASMSDADGERFNVNPREHVAFDVVKSNYTPKIPSRFYFRRGPGGVLEYTNLFADRISGIVEALVAVLAENGAELTRRELESQAPGKEAAAALAERIPGFKRVADLRRAIDHGLESGALRAVSRGGRGKWKTVILPAGG
jgi:replicative DNA helicase